MNKVKVFKLSNGLNVIYAPRRETKSLALALVCRAGSMYERENEVGAAHLLEHSTLDRTEKYPKKGQVNSIIEDAGGASRAFTSRDTIKYTAKTVLKESEKAFEYLSEVVNHPTLPEEKINNEKKIVVQEIQRAQHDYGRVAYEACIQNFYKGDRMAISNLGTESSVNGIERKTLVDFRERHFKAGNTTLSICGNLDFKIVSNLAEKYFQDMPEGEAVTRDNPEVNLGKHLQLINKEDTTQSHVVILYRAPGFADKEFLAFEIARAAMSMGKSSRLFRAVREEHGLAYIIQTMLFPWTVGGEFWIYTAVDENNANKTIKVIAEEAQKILKDGFSEEEVERAKNAVISRYVFNSEDSLNLASFYADRFLLRDNTRVGFEEEMGNYESVTTEEVNQAAKNVLSQNPKVAVVSKKITENDIDVGVL